MQVVSPAQVVIHALVRMKMMFLPMVSFGRSGFNVRSVDCGCTKTAQLRMKRSSYFAFVAMYFNNTTYSLLFHYVIALMAYVHFWCMTFNFVLKISLILQLKILRGYFAATGNGMYYNECESRE